MTLLDIHKTAKTALKEAGIESYSLDAALLLAHAIGETREFVVGYPEYELSTNELEIFKTLLERRKKREPLAKIIGKKEFWGREFKVNHTTLDPRPDSETLIEAIIAQFPDQTLPLKIIDFGTGSGCLLLTILAEYGQSQGMGVDINPETLDVAKENAVKLGLANRCELVLNSWTDGVKGKFNIIISNPPYIKTPDIENLAPEVSIYEPYTALAGGNDGLECYRLLAPHMKNLLADNGYLFFEFGMGQENELRHILEQEGLQVISFKNDLSGIPRCLVARSA